MPKGSGKGRDAMRKRGHMPKGSGKGRDAMRKKKIYAMRAAVFGIALVFVWNNLGTMEVQALLDEAQAVHITASEIEDATLLIGTHLIHLSAMNDEIYRIAADSASQSGQDLQYYKSELAEGMWFDISNAFSLKDITKEGAPVEDEVINGLFLTHHTKSDGITYDLRTGQPVCMFNLSDPYDLEHLSELEPLKLQYDILAGKEDKDETDEFFEEKIREFFGMDVRDEETGNLDAQLLGLQNYYVQASPEDRPSVTAVMEAVDAARRSMVLGRLREPLGQLMELLLGNQAGISLEAGGELKEGAKESLKNLEEGILTYDSMKLAEGTTILGKEEYAVSQALADAARAGDLASCENLAKKAALLSSIKQNATRDAKKELEYLKNTILPAAKKAYEDLLINGPGEKYKKEASQENASQGMLDAALKEQFYTAQAAKSELQFLEHAALSKMSAQEGKDFLQALLQEGENLKNSIREDAFSSYAKDSIDSYASDLNTLYAQRNPTEHESGRARLLEQKEKKQEERLSALEANDLAGAKKAEAQIEELDRQIGILEKQMEESGEPLGEDTAEGSDAAGSQQNADAAEGERAGILTLSQEELQRLLEELAGGKLGELGKEEQAAVLLALLEFLEQYQSATSKEMAQILAAQMEAHGNPYIFRQYNDPVYEYIPVKNISGCLGFRYVFDNQRKKATLAGKGSFYTFHAFASTYEKGEGTGELSRNAGFMEDIYLPEEDAQELFQCSSRYVPESGLALLVTKEMETRASEYLSMLLASLGV